MTFQMVLQKEFPGALREKEYVEKTKVAITPFGFTADNSIACVGICRDEITQSLALHVKEAWGEAFNFSSLAGMLFLGKTGFSAAEHHAPNEDGKERYLFFALPHIAVGETGEIGVCVRAGRQGTSSACGALHGIQKELSGGTLRLGIDFDDVEQSLIRMKILGRISYGHAPDLLEMTKIALSVIQDDLKRMIGLTVSPERSDYAVFTGIQVHCPDGNYIYPVSSYAVVNQITEEIELQKGTA